VLEVELKLEKVTPQPFRRDAHHWLILHGRYICKARLPECWRCPVIDLCRYKPKTPPLRAPARSNREPEPGQQLILRQAGLPRSRSGRS
jgi:endonuclease-3